MNVYIAIITVLQLALLVTLVITMRRGRRLRMLESQYTPFWKAFQTEITAALHHPHPESFRMDYLMGKLDNLTITQEETAELKTLARTIVDDPGQSPKERQLAEFLLFAMPRVIEEALLKPGAPTAGMSPPTPVGK
jgi:hypothetical protein